MDRKTVSLVGWPFFLNSKFQISDPEQAIWNVESGIRD